MQRLFQRGNSSARAHANNELRFTGIVSNFEHSPRVQKTGKTTKTGRLPLSLSSWNACWPTAGRWCLPQARRIQAHSPDEGEPPAKDGNGYGWFFGQFWSCVKKTWRFQNVTNQLLFRNRLQAVVAQIITPRQTCNIFSSWVFTSGAHYERIRSQRIGFIFQCIRLFSNNLTPIRVQTSIRSTPWDLGGLFSSEDPIVDFSRGWPKGTFPDAGKSCEIWF